MTSEVEIKQAEFNIQPKFAEAFFDQRRFICLSGGRSSGKSYFASQKCLYRLYTEEETRILVIMKVQSALDKKAYKMCIDVINDYNLNEYYSCYTSPMKIICNTTGNEMHFAGIDKAENIRGWAGINSVWIDEADKITINDFKMINTTIRANVNYKHYMQILLAFNPVSKTNWIYKNFYQEKIFLPCGYYKSTPSENIYLHEDTVDSIYSTYRNDEEGRKVFYDGDWSDINTEMIYTNWTTDASISQNFDDYKIKYAGIDFGFQDPNCVLCVGFNEDKVFVFKELYLKKYTNQEFIPEIKKIVPRHILCIADARSPGNILELKNAGIYIRPSDKTPNSINAGINWLKGKKILIHPDCKNFIEEIKQFSYVYNEDDDIFSDKPTQGHEHLLDCLRYSCDPLRQRKFVTAGIKIF